MGRWAFLADPDLVRFLLGGLALTLEVAAGAILLSTVLGTGLALLRLSSHVALRLPALVYIEIVRSLPSFLVVVYTFSQTAEIIRAGVLSVEQGRARRPKASGLTARQSFFVIVLPHFTGSKHHNVKLRELAVRKKLKISEYGVFDERGRRVAGATEEEVYHRLDLRDVHARRARELGLRLSIDTDAHSLTELDHMALGVATARRAWIGPAHVVNALPLAKLLAWARAGR